MKSIVMSLLLVSLVFPQTVNKERQEYVEIMNKASNLIAENNRIASYLFDGIKLEGLSHTIQVPEKDKAGFISSYQANCDSLAILIAKMRVVKFAR